jgi:hypothetical protein
VVVVVGIWLHDLGDPASRRGVAGGEGDAIDSRDGGDSDESERSELEHGDI